MRRALVLLCALVVLGLAAQLVALGASSVWSTYQHEAGRAGADPDQAPVTSIGPAWNETLDGGLYAQPLVVGNTVFAATQNNTVYAFAADAGNPVWPQPRHVATPPRLSQLPCGTRGHCRVPRQRSRRSRGRGATAKPARVADTGRCGAERNRAAG